MHQLQRVSGEAHVEKPWLKSYPEGVPAEIDTGEYRSIVDMYADSVQRYRDRTAYMNFGKEITFNDWDRLSRDFGAYLQSLGLQKGDRIALMMPNIMQYPVAIMGALAIVETLEAAAIAFLFSGAVVTETIFSWPGMGSYLVERIGQRRDCRLPVVVTKQNRPFAFP